MKFADLLREYIGQRPLESVIAACAERGVQIESPQLSRMRSGTRPAPTEENVIRVLAEVCGRDPEPLILLAKYQRAPHEVMEKIIEAFVFADKARIHFEDQADIERHLLVARLQAGETVPTDQVLAALTAEEPPHVERLRDVFDRYRERAFEMINLLVDSERASWGTPGEAGTMVVEDPKQGLSREEELVVRLAEVAGIPSDILEELVAAGKRIADKKGERFAPIASR